MIPAIYRTSLVLAIFTMAACNETAKKQPVKVATIADTAKTVSLPPDSVEVVSERINGPANIRDAINGDVIFSLEDSTMVTCTEAVNNWQQVGLAMEVTDEQVANNILRKGTKIIIDGKVCGELLKDVQVSSYTNNTSTWAELTGFTHRDNIYPYSIIEPALETYLAKATDRSMTTLLPFVHRFKMEQDDFASFLIFFTYENWIDDPSPLMRLELIFKDDKLLGVVHSRDLKLPDSKEYTLERGFKATFFNDTKQDVRSAFIKEFNNFINQVD